MILLWTGHLFFLYIKCWNFLKDILCSSLSNIILLQKCIEIYKILTEYVLLNLNKRTYKLCMGICVPYYRSREAGSFLKNCQILMTLYIHSVPIYCLGFKALYKVKTCCFFIFLKGLCINYRYILLVGSWVSRDKPTVSSGRRRVLGDTIW
jgi:hypothetical protein